MYTHYAGLGSRADEIEAIFFDRSRGGGGIPKFLRVSRPLSSLLLEILPLLREYEVAWPIVLQKYHGVVRNSRHTLRLQPSVNRRGFPCPRCARVFRTSGGMSRHYRLECVDMPRFKCPHCEMRSKYTQAVYRHIRAKHRNMELRFVKLY
ncbi:Uncharacterized protein DBV15_09041 [Temnothorax longispinosus]|uniref:C2H2-type domain-containing protein n=1 Tax=Temnothorax longispinosus TaxID=300112 RepID=A0A4S2KME5_9HYME|nr:Uncharacterized protein DBV15_09041 [Temnothorax longispinosus]